MQTRFKNFALRPSILTLFVVLTVPFFLGIVGVTYITNDRIARTNAEELVARFLKDAVQEMSDMFEPIKSLIRSAAVIGDDQPGFFADDKSLNYLNTMLSHSDKIISVYVGMDDGSFRQARRIDPNVKIQDNLPPEAANLAYRVIEPPKDGRSIDRYTFIDAQRRELGRSGQQTSYDPRVRPWYTTTVMADGLVVTEPDVFAALGLIGFTVAAPFHQGAKIAGVAAADITLDGLSEYLSEHKISPGSLTYIIDSQGRVIANSERAKTYSSESGRVQLQHITAVDNELPAQAFSARPRGSDRQYSFQAGGEEYIGKIVSFPPQFGQRWQLFVITPLKDFTQEFDRHNRQLLLLGLAVILIQILIIYGLSSVVSSPLEKLALKVAKIQDLENGGALATLDSPIREVAVLSRAIDTLDAAVRSFAAFVPIGLVRQLLETDQKLELGGNSRFLTILFSDLEGFSTLSEEVPSQELFLLISSYLELVTKSVNQEHGTIDKFIGDGAMAFWGAPALLDDHAWRACVAALRIQHGMKELNAHWGRERPLRVRVGIHSDGVLVGNIGSKARMSYTVMGDGVNLAARLEGINKEFGTCISISHSVFKEAGERLCVRPMFEVVVKGRRAKTPVYELLGALGAGAEFEPDPETLRLCRMTRFAYEALVAEDITTALERYQVILAEFPGDPVATELTRRLSAPELAGRVQNSSVA